MNATTNAVHNYPTWWFEYWGEDRVAAWKATAPEAPYGPGWFAGMGMQGCISVGANYWYGIADSFEQAVESGKSYMVGDDVPMAQYIKHHRSPVTKWQKQAYAWVLEHPHFALDITTPGHEWVVRKRGNYVEFGLPHQDAGGERHYISQDGKTKILVNLD